jgi:hypothetical protein
MNKRRSSLWEKINKISTELPKVSQIKVSKRKIILCRESTISSQARLKLVSMAKP